MFLCYIIKCFHFFPFASSILAHFDSIHHNIHCSQLAKQSQSFHFFNQKIFPQFLSTPLDDSSPVFAILFYAEVDIWDFSHAFCHLDSLLFFLMMRKTFPALHKTFGGKKVPKHGCGSTSHYESLRTAELTFFSSSFGNVGNALQPARKERRRPGLNRKQNTKKLSSSRTYRKKKEKSESQFFIQLHSRSSTHQRRAEAGYREVKKCVTICLMSMRLKIELGHWVVVESMENDWSTSKQPEAETRRGFSPHSVVWCRDLGLSRRLFKSDIYRGWERDSKWEKWEGWLALMDHRHHPAKVGQP